MADKVLHLPTRFTHASARPEPLWREVVGEQLRAERVSRDLRIVDVAQRAGVAPQYLSEIERGRKDASSEVLSALCGALGLATHEITGRASVRLVGTANRVRTRNRSDGPVCLAA
jgi:transcriptional regulator with XRE-family HTH domain